MSIKNRFQCNNKSDYWRRVAMFFVVGFTISLNPELLAATTYTITTVAGNGNPGYDGDGGPATTASLSGPHGVVVDNNGNIFIADSDNSTIRKVDHVTGIISTVASSLAGPLNITISGNSDIYFSDTQHNVVKKIDHAFGTVSTFAGTGSPGYAGDAGPASAALLNSPRGIGVDGYGNIFINDWGNCRIRKIDHGTNIITTVAGNGVCGYNGDNILATTASVNGSCQIALDLFGNLFIPENNGNSNGRVRKVDHSTNIITTVAGIGVPGFSGDGGPASQAMLSQPCGVQLNSIGDLFISDTVNWRIRKVDHSTGIISTIAGNGAQGFGGDGGLATLASLDYSHEVDIDSKGNIFIADARNNRVRKLTPDTIPAPPQLLSLGDINKDGAPEIAVVTHNPTLKKTTATVKNAQTGGLVQQIVLDRRFVPTKANILPDLNGNGAPEIAVLGVRSSDQAVQVEVRDSLSGVKLSAVPFDSTFTALDLGVVRDISGKGTAGLAVLQQSDTELRVQLKNAVSGVQIGNINFSAGYKGIDLLVLGDLNGNRAKEIAVLADNKTVTAADTVEIRDSKTGVLIRTISYGTGKDLQQLINLPDLNNSGGAELAVLRANTARVLVKDAKTGLPVNTLDYAVSQPFRLATVADSNSQTNLAMLGVRAANGQPRADVHDPLSDTFINKVLFDNYGTTVGFIAIPDINGNGVAELVRLREQPGPQKLFAEVRDGRTGALIQGMYF